MEAPASGSHDYSRFGRTSVDVPPVVMDRVRELYDAGLMIQAYEASRIAGPLRTWKSVQASIMAARLARNIGGARLGQALIRRAYFLDPANPRARYFRAGELIHRRGPFAAWEFMRQFGTLEDADPVTRADWLAYLAEIAWCFRDFDAADSLIARAMDVAGATPWLCVMRARSLEAQDRYEDALAAVRQALELRAWYFPGVQITAHLLQLLDRDQESLALLSEASNKIESGSVVWQLAGLQIGLELYDDASDSLDRVEKLMPLMESPGLKGLLAMRSDVSYHRGETEAAVDLARKSENKFLAKVVDSMATAAPAAKRMRLKVPFVRQHHMTCAPATLSAISQFWSMKVDQFAVVAEICYDGTPFRSERRWAIDHGWTVFEFKVTWDAAKALIDRGVPFTLTTTEVTTSHLQAVVGYDERRHTLLVRDPFRYYQGEFHADLLFERYKATGPRGMALVPVDRTNLLEGLNLPDSELYDLLYELGTALEQHDRATAQRALEAMQAHDAEHRLALLGARSLAHYDGDPSSELRVVERWLKTFPDDSGLKFMRLFLLRSLGQREQRLGELVEICHKGATDPVFYQELANDLAVDAREHTRCIRLLNKALRRQPRSGASLHGLAGIYGAKLDHEKALELYRFAACLDDKNESAAQSYFTASRYERKTNEAMAMLSSRFERFGARSSQPALTLSWALETLSRLPEAMDVLLEAQRRRPDDGDLILHTSRTYARTGGSEKAKTLLSAAKGKTHAANWLRSAATLASSLGNLVESLSLWRQVLNAQPLAMDAHEATARLTAETESPAAALQCLETACTRYPHFVPLMRLRIGWLRREGAEAAEPVARALVQQHASDAWARRELALALIELRRYEEASDEAAMGFRLEPTSPASNYVLGMVFSRLDRVSEAQACWRESIRLSVDYQFSINALVGSCATNAERREALRFVHSELVRQVVFGDGLLAYRQQASTTLQPKELLDDLREALSARPDLWHAWIAVIGQLTTMDQLNEAMELARQATHRFPLVSRVWTEMANVCHLRGDRREEIEALEESLRIMPAESNASQQLAGALSRDGNLRKARRVMKDAITRNSLDGANHATLAELLWRMNKRKAAVVHAKRAVLLDPQLQSTWDQLRQWSAMRKRPEEAIELARQLTVRRAGEVRSWLILAQMLSGDTALEERLAACEKALSLNPRSIEVADLKATLLSQAKRFDEALAACLPAAWSGSPPLPMRGRAAWILAQRGKLPEAIQQMRAILHEEPFYYWGWQTLCHWLQSGKNGADFLDAASEMAKFFPNDVGTLTRLARAQIRNAQRVAGKATYSRVLAISPLDEAGFRLFDAQLEDHELDEAARTLALLLQHQDGPWARQREITLMARRGDREGVAKQFFEATKWVLTDPAPFDAAVKEIEKAKLGELVDIILYESLQKRQGQSPTAEEARLAELGMNRVAKSRKWRQCRQMLKKLESREMMWAAAVVPYINELSAAKCHFAVRRISSNYRDKLKRETRAWGTMGYGLLSGVKNTRHLRKVVKWLSDYEPRRDAQPWMLSNLSTSLRRLGRDKEAYEASRYALGLVEDRTTSHHVIWMALDELIASRPGDGVLRFSNLDKTALPARQQFLAKLLEAMRECDGQHPTEHKILVAAAKNSLLAARKSYPGYAKSPELKRAYWRTVKRMVRKIGGIRMHLWAISQK